VDLLLGEMENNFLGLAGCATQSKATCSGEHWSPYMFTVIVFSSVVLWADLQTASADILFGNHEFCELQLEWVTTGNLSQNYQCLLHLCLIAIYEGLWINDIQSNLKPTRKICIVISILQCCMTWLLHKNLVIFSNSSLPIQFVMLWLTRDNY
jgi:hypothetical protein